jgi:hypothetical protein
MANGSRRSRRDDRAQGDTELNAVDESRLSSQRATKSFGNEQRRLKADSGCFLAPDDSPLVTRDISTQEIYALEMDWP